MVIQDDSDTPVEVSVMKTPHLESKKYVIVKNHVRELPLSDHASSGHSSSQDHSSATETSAKKMKKPSKEKKKVKVQATGEDSTKAIFDRTNDHLQSIRRHLEDFRSELHKCFDRLGVKLDQIVQSIDSSQSSLTNDPADSNSEGDCHCQLNTKIIFDEDGQKSVTEPTSDNHMCPKKLKRKYSDVAKNIDIHNLVMAQKSKKDTQNLAIEYEEQNIELPEDLCSLANILKDSNIAVSYRNTVINKVKSIKQEHTNEIRFNRPSMIEILKSDADSSQVFEFKGANLFTLPGYPEWK